MKLIRTIKMSQTLATCNTPWAMLKGVRGKGYKLTSRQLGQVRRRLAASPHGTGNTWLHMALP